MTIRNDLTDANSRLLGIGERIEEGIWVKWAEYDGQPTQWGKVDSTFSLLGLPVEADESDCYRRELPAADEPNTSFSTGAVRTRQEGRGRFDLIPYEAMLSLARRLEMGSAIYGDRNWEKGMPLSRYLSSLRRHAMQINYDPSEDHLGAVLFNAAAFIATAERVKAGILPKELDDIGYLAQQASPSGQGYFNEIPPTPSTVIRQIK